MKNCAYQLNENDESNRYNTRQLAIHIEYDLNVSKNFSVLHSSHTIDGNGVSLWIPNAIFSYFFAFSFISDVIFDTKQKNQPKKIST